MLWLLAFFGSVVEVAEIPTIIVLVIWVVRLRRQIKALDQRLQERLWEAGLDAPPSITEPHPYSGVHNSQ